jgi:hypothetical protein
MMSASALFGRSLWMCIERLRLPSPFGKTKAAPLSTLLTKAAFLSLPDSSGVLHCIPRNTFSLTAIILIFLPYHNDTCQYF